MKKESAKEGKSSLSLVRTKHSVCQKFVAFEGKNRAHKPLKNALLVTRRNEILESEDFQQRRCNSSPKTRSGLVHNAKVNGDSRSKVVFFGMRNRDTHHQLVVSIN